MKILVVGAGAVGGYYGALLARAGHAVTFVARGEHGRAIREHGLWVDTPDDDPSIVCRAPVLADIALATGFGAEVALIAVKAADLPAIAPAIGHALAEDGIAIPLLNGLDSEDVLAAAIGRDKVVGGIAQIAARITGLGHIRVDAPARIVLAPLPPVTPEKMMRVEGLAATFGAAGFDCEAKRDLARTLWTKLLWNAPFNAICALTRLSAGEVLAVPELATLVRTAMVELAAVARAENVTIDDALIDATLEATRVKFHGSIPSMLQDVRAGRQTEAHSLQGAVVTRGERHNIEVPIHRTLLALVVGLSPPRA
jgi:2-dehydropantoate 2-reductase